MTRDQASRVARTAFQVSLPALLVLLNDVTNAVKTLDRPTVTPFLIVFLTVLTSALHQQLKPAAVPPAPQPEVPPVAPPAPVVDPNAWPKF